MWSRRFIMGSGRVLFSIGSLGWERDFEMEDKPLLNGHFGRFRRKGTLCAGRGEPAYDRERSALTIALACGVVAAQVDSF